MLTPDFQGNEAALRLVVDAAPEILNHNIETVPRLYRIAKSGGRYPRSLRFLGAGEGDESPTQVTKTGIIVGLGEEMHELLAVFRDLADRKVDILTIGQYLRPVEGSPGDEPLLHAGRVRLPEARGARAWASGTWSRARWCAPATTRRSRRNRPGWRNRSSPG